MKNINQIAERLVALTQNKLFLEAQSELFSENAISIEPENSGRKSAYGLKEMQEKELNFLNNIKEWKAIEVSQPLVTQTFFSIKMFVDVILKNDQRVIVNEIIVYEIENYKIIKEQFFY